MEIATYLSLPVDWGGVKGARFGVGERTLFVAVPLHLAPGQGESGQTYGDVLLEESVGCVGGSLISVNYSFSLVTGPTLWCLWTTSTYSS